MNKPAYTASEWIIHTWSLGGVSYYWMSAVIFSFLSFVFVTSYEMSPFWVGLAMMLPRMIDIIVDPVLGRLSDNTHSRWGRRRPFIFVTTVLGAALVVGIWWMPLDWIEKVLFNITLPWGWGTYAVPWSFAYLLTFTTLLFANLGCFEMSHTALGYELSDDYAQRSKVQAVRAFYFSLGSLGGGYTYWLAQRAYFGTGQLGEVNGFRQLSFIMGALVLIFGLIPVFTCRERFQNINRKKHVPIWPALKATLKNRPFVVILAMRFINILGTSLFGNLVFYIGVYSVCRGDKGLYNNVIAGWNGVAGFILGIALVPLAAPITRWLGKRRGIIICYGLGCVLAVLTPFIMQPGTVYLWFFVGLIFAPATVVLGNLLASVMPDICDMDELEHGERREGLFTAVMSFMTKLESSVCTGLGGGMLVLSGFNQHLIQQPQEVLDKMRLYAFAPLIVGAFLTFFVACFFPLSKKTMDEVRAKLDARHAAAHIAGVEAAAGKAAAEA